MTIDMSDIVCHFASGHRSATRRCSSATDDPLPRENVGRGVATPQPPGRATGRRRGLWRSFEPHGFVLLDPSGFVVRRLSRPGRLGRDVPVSAAVVLIVSETPSSSGAATGASLVSGDAARSKPTIEVKFWVVGEFSSSAEFHTRRSDVRRRVAA